MRGDAALRARLLIRPAGAAGVVAALAGTTAAVAAYVPWYEVVAEVAALGTEQSGVVATLAGWEAHPWGWVVVVLGALAVLGGLALALDRPAPFTTEAGLGVGLLLALTVGAAGLWFPSVARFDVAGSRLRELTAVADRLPEDVGLSFSVRPGVGLWMALGAAAVIVVTAFTTRRLS